MSWSPEDSQTLATLRSGGMDFHDIARKLGKTHNSVTSRARRMGLPMTFSEVGAASKRVWTDAEDALIRTGVAVGLSYNAIALKIGVSCATVSSRAYNIGIRREVEPERTRVDRWNCGHCATRSDAPLDFGCAKCLPLRRVAA